MEYQESGADKISRKLIKRQRSSKEAAHRSGVGAGIDPFITRGVIDVITQQYT